jgi:hypothetical protein
MRYTGAVTTAQDGTPVLDLTRIGARNRMSATARNSVVLSGKKGNRRCPSPCLGSPNPALTAGQLTADDCGTLGQRLELGEGGLARSRDSRWVQKRCTSLPVSCLR